MKKIFSLLLACAIFTASYTQVGIGNNTPRGLMDVNNNKTVTDPLNVFKSFGSDKGMVVPIVETTTSLDGAVEGTVVYDLTDHCLKVLSLNGGKLSFISTDLEWTCIYQDTPAYTGVKLPEATLSILSTGIDTLGNPSVTVSYTYSDLDNVASGEIVRILDPSNNNSIVSTASIALQPSNELTFSNNLTPGHTYTMQVYDSEGVHASVQFYIPVGTESSGSLNIASGSGSVTDTSITLDYSYTDVDNTASGEQVQVFAASDTGFTNPLSSPQPIGSNGQVTFNNLTPNQSYVFVMTDSTHPLTNPLAKVTSGTSIFIESFDGGRPGMKGSIGSGYIYRDIEGGINTDISRQGDCTIHYNSTAIHSFHLVKPYGDTGKFFAMNSLTGTTAFYKSPTISTTVGQRYRLSLYAINPNGGSYMPVNLQLQVNSTGATIATRNFLATGSDAYSLVTLDFTANASSINFDLLSLSAANNGYDLIIDEIMVAPVF